jgi:hypothetical protein
MSMPATGLIELWDGYTNTPSGTGAALTWTGQNGKILTNNSGTVVSFASNALTIGSSSSMNTTTTFGAQAQPFTVCFMMSLDASAVNGPVAAWSTGPARLYKNGAVNRLTYTDNTDFPDWPGDGMSAGVFAPVFLVVGEAALKANLYIGSGIGVAPTSLGQQTCLVTTFGGTFYLQCDEGSGNEGNDVKSYKVIGIYSGAMGSTDRQTANDYMYSGPVQPFQNPYVQLLAQ